MNDLFYIIEKSTGRKFSKFVRARGIRVDAWRGQGAVTRIMNANALHATHDAVQVENYKPVMVERRNLMSGEPYMEDINTPCYCSPACESYWTM